MPIVSYDNQTGCTVDILLTGKFSDDQTGCKPKKKFDMPKERRAGVYFTE